MVRVAIPLGSTLGDRDASLRRAADGLAAFIHRLTLSSFIETAPIGADSPQPWYLNAAAIGFTTLKPRPLLEALLALERPDADRLSQTPTHPPGLDAQRR